MQWISIIVTFVGAFVFGMLAHRSPKEDWEFIKTWPAFALLCISGVIGQMVYAQKQVEQLLPPPEFICEWIVDDNGMPTKECSWVVDRSNFVEPPPNPLVGWLWGLIRSVLQDVPLELIGIKLGMITMRQADGSRKTT